MLSPQQRLVVRSAGNPRFDPAYQLPDTGTSSGRSPLYRSRHNAMIGQRFVRTGSSASRIPERTAAPTADEAVKNSHSASGSPKSGTSQLTKRDRGTEYNADDFWFAENTSPDVKRAYSAFSCPQVMKWREVLEVDGGATGA
jgi:hypothetical protein